MTTSNTHSEIQTALLESQRRVLERIASGAPLTESMDTLVRLIEQHAEGLRCAVLLADPGGERLMFVAAPSVPDDYKTGIEPYLRIAPDMGSCGTAAFLRKPVYTKDTAEDALWKGCRDIAVRNGLRAIWSTPILGDGNAVLGTFAMYYGVPRLPSPEHVQLIDMAVQMARVAIEAKRGQEALQRSEARLRLVAETIRTLVWGALLAGSVEAGSSHAGAPAKSIAVDSRLVLERRALDSLTSNERAILRLITEGKSSAAVGDVLHLSRRTVETYRARLMQKLQVDDLAALVKFAIRNGITSVD